jgi:hypothetical protein
MSMTNESVEEVDDGALTRSALAKVQQEDLEPACDAIQTCKRQQPSGSQRQGKRV